MFKLRCSYCATNFCEHSCECKCHIKNWTKTS